MEMTTPPAFNQPNAPMGAIDAYKAFWQNFATFTGRSTRGQYWWPVLFNTIIALVLNLLGYFSSGFGLISGAFGLVTLIPGLAVASRRLHDIGKAFGWYFIIFIPLVGGIIYLVWCCKPGEPGVNRFGANPAE